MVGLAGVVAKAVGAVPPSRSAAAAAEVRAVAVRRESMGVLLVRQSGGARPGRGAAAGDWRGNASYCSVPGEERQAISFDRSCGDEVSVQVRTVG
ncbi:hypothetical protein GCM10010502_13550 [Kitasatospora aureofaciens]|uniref:Uncharacterized protein n=1 Tax=Kitasatospora aureofaciens TaxID=1894 RepID=A0A8H9LM57_KITAU|nr:hypothetical protein GCM10010502_13550 [Kitasatospora aureofaciens]